MPVLASDRIELREFAQQHLDSPEYYSWLLELENVIPIYRMEYLLHVSRDDVAAYVRGLWKSGTDRFFAVHERPTDKFIGTQRIGHINWRSGIGDLGIMIGDRQAQGKGYGTEALALACAYAYGPLSLRRLTGGTAEGNMGMIRCFLKNNFREEGRLRKHLLINGQYEDHVLFGRLKDDSKPL